MNDSALFPDKNEKSPPMKSKTNKTISKEKDKYAPPII
jgi:hypothetical protein